MVKSHNTPRSFKIQIPDGFKFRRNRPQLLKSREESVLETKNNDQEYFHPSAYEPTETISSKQAPAPHPIKETENPKAATEETMTTSHFSRLIKPPKHYSM